MSHTPGPWFQYADSPLVIVNAAGSSLGEASAGDPFIPMSQQLANARLFAASTELLAALQDVLRIATAASVGVSGNQPRLERARAAIAKASGAAT